MGRLQELWLKQKGQIAEAARPFLDPGDDVRFVILCQTRLPNWLAPIPFGAIYGVKKRALIVATKNAYVVAMLMLSPTKVSGLVEKHALAPGTLIPVGMGAIQMGRTKLWPVGSAVMRRELDEALASSGSA